MSKDCPNYSLDTLAGSEAEYTEKAMATKGHQATEPSVLESTSTGRNAVMVSVSDPPMVLGTNNRKKLASAIASIRDPGRLIWDWMWCLAA